ncbi:CatB-related O-acetyltransferase [Vibrio splendidus]|uniref:CatB-related O-acetyltransferase n=1 Tax=Vibrio splendidus TaxID=29497 RepID=UPI000C832207|nr:CatB-related O-acetyltransferase [Vibrio splendidus]PMO71086.1 hypothetical protein BCT03_20260 [Vibrio splendidus]
MSYSTFKKILFRIFKPLYIVRLKKSNVHMAISAIFDGNTKLEGANNIMSRTQIKESEIGFGTYIGEDCLLNRVKVGRYCSIGSNVKVLINDHPTQQYVSTHPAFYNGSHPLMRKLKLNFHQVKKNYITDFEVNIGSDVWLGTDVIIMSGVNVGDGAIIGAGAIVTKDIKPYSINVGVPAKCHSYRFTDKQIERLKKKPWWNKSKTELELIRHSFLNIEEFLDEKI